jgi:gluconolactonase
MPAGEPAAPLDEESTPATTPDGAAPAARDAGEDPKDDPPSPREGGSASSDRDGGTSSPSVMLDGGSSDGGAIAQLDGATSDGSTPTPVDAGPPVVTTWPRLESAQIGAPKKIAGGFGLAESPLWDHCGQRLLFPDVNANTIHQLGSDGKISAFMTNTYYANGLAFDRDGTLLMAQMGGGGGGRVSRRLKDGTVQIVVDKDPAGRAFYTVDDIVVHSDGTIYFTDGDFPHGPYLGFTLLGELSLYILRPNQPMKKLVSGHAVRGPNGVELSPDEQTLYLSSYFSSQIVKLKVAADGSLNTPSVFAGSLDNSDSFCVDAAGNIYAAMASGLQVVRPDGTRVKSIPITSVDGTTNCGFGGVDGKTLFITSWTDLYKIEGMPIPGLDWVKNRSLSCSP